MRIEFTEEIQSTKHLLDRSSYIVSLEFDSGIALEIYYRHENMFFVALPAIPPKKVIRLYRIHFNDADELEAFKGFFFQEDLKRLSPAAQKQLESLVQGKLLGLKQRAAAI